MRLYFPSKNKLFFSIFKKGSITFSVSSSFFPKQVREDVTTFYAFVRVIDDLVDEKPIQARAFYRAKQCFYDELAGKKSNYTTMREFAKLVKKKNINIAYIDSFFNAMEWDLQAQFQITTLKKCLWYMHGSAEVVGLIMCKLCNVADESLHSYAALLGRAMQYINFIRDLVCDTQKGRHYIPHIHAIFPNISQQNALTHPDTFCTLIRQELHRYLDWVLSSAKGMKALPHEIRIPLITATELYHTIALKIYKNPMIVFEKKLRANKYFALKLMLSNMLLRKKTPNIKMF